MSGFGAHHKTLLIPNHPTNHNPTTPQKDRPQMMAGVKRSKPPLNAKEAPSLPRKLAMRGGDHRRHSAGCKCAPFIIYSLDFLLTFSSRKK
jgi:hypothetical protein